MSKAELAGALQVEPASIRRLFSSDKTNPILGTLAEVAAALGLRITVEPLGKDERRRVTGPLDGRLAEPKKLAKHLDAMRTRKPKVPA